MGNHHPVESVGRIPLVLLVDDDLTTLTTLDRLLRGAGLETLRAGTLAEARALLRGHAVSLALLDVHLPDGNGLDLCRTLAGTSTTPVLFISGDGDLATKTAGFAAGGVDYITKPLAGLEVLARVRTHLRLHAAQASLATLYAERLARVSCAQQAMMPRPDDLPQARFDVCLRQAHQAGGDFYDVIRVGSTIVDYVVADVSGHDAGVSLWTAAVKTALADRISVVDSPLETYRAINHSLARVLPEGVYVTAIHARLDRAAKRMTLVNAGHPSAILVSGSGRDARLLEQQGDVLGPFADAAFGVLDVRVEAGDRLFLYSDGLVETRGSREVGCTRALELCRRTADLSRGDSVPTIVDGMCGADELADDVVLLAVDV